MVEKKTVDWLKKTHRYTTYLAAASLYLKQNYWLKTPLQKEDIKERIIGHWGTSPGLTLIYALLDILVREYQQKMMLITGPGHGAPAILAHTHLEGSLAKVWGKYTADQKGAEQLMHDFSWPGALPSHTYPGVPGSIHEGGELGYSLGVAFGAAFDNPSLCVACIIGDGEAETGALAASWMSNRFYNPHTDGFVLPIVHINGYKISNPTLFGTMDDEELKAYFAGHGYVPIVVNQYTAKDIYTESIQAFYLAYEALVSMRETWQSGEKPLLPVIVMRTMKGWTGPKSNPSHKLEDSNYSHGIPLSQPRTNDTELAILQSWLQSYKVHELMNDDGISKEITGGLPTEQDRIGNSLLSQRKPHLQLPLRNVTDTIQRGKIIESKMEVLGEYLGSIGSHSLNSHSFRVFSPDESESNLLESSLKDLGKNYQWPVRKWDNYIQSNGRVMEILSEQTLQSWMQGYVQTGRNGILISYEAFLSIVEPQVMQYLKFLRQSSTFVWRQPLASLVYVATSTGWRQEHNGYTHQNPSFAHTLLSKPNAPVEVHYATDSQVLLALTERAFYSTNQVHLITAEKRPLPRWLSCVEAQDQAARGVAEWKWLSTPQTTEYDIVLASAGDTQTVEMIAAISLLQAHVPQLKIKYINITTLTPLGFGTADYPLITRESQEQYFEKNVPILLSFHGYPQSVYQLLHGTNLAHRITVLGYQEKGSTTTPFDMQVLNETSRYHIVLKALQMVLCARPDLQEVYHTVAALMHSKLQYHAQFIKEYGKDIPEVTDWKFEK